MEAGTLSETGPEDRQIRQTSLSSEIIRAVNDVIGRGTGKTFKMEPAVFPNPESEPDPAQLAMAVAYTSLCIEEPDMVTSSHKKMLRSAFSYEQIQELNELIKKMLA